MKTTFIIILSLLFVSLSVFADNTSNSSSINPVEVNTTDFSRLNLVDAHTADFSSMDADHTVNAMNRYISPCISWTSNPSGWGYVCNYYDSMVEVVDANEVRRMAQQFDRKLRDLESRIQALESK